MLKHIRNILFIFIGMVAAGYLALVCVYTLPIGPIQKNVAEAANIMQMDGSHPELVYGHQDTMLDNLTDSIMLLTARYEGTESFFEEALLNNRFTVNGLMDSEVLAVEAEGEELDGTESSYGRYWHGYLLYVKPLLMVLNYGQIRYFVGAVQFALLVLVLYLFVKTNKEKHVLPFTVAYLFLNPAALSLSLQYFPASVITMIEFVVILINQEKYKINPIRWIYHFFIVGCLIAYFDFLTFPLLTLGMPLVFLMVENQKTIKRDSLLFAKSCAAWGIGYASMWGSKWILGSLLTKKNMLADAIGQVLFRVGAAENEVKTSAIEAIIRNIGANKLYLLLTISVFFGIILYKILKKENINLKSVNISVLLCAILPFLWYMVVSNHSYIHYWFTYRILAISIYAILIFATTIFCKRERG